ncbi:Pullulanase 1, chloroplastic [Sesamum angolense]|uniref:Pullulanase 1, chloroplastic n=1 Tax=Sesamum angolense TaxID=2727404 RepID=A0AAE1X6U8_9LAMI|nr:Pullulanase 1, chloroplastic [Sesamum angolense]
MSLLRSSPPFLSTSKKSRSPCLPLQSHPLTTCSTRRRLGGCCRIVKLRASSKRRCSATMAICEGSTSSSSPLQDSMLYARAFWVSKSIIAWDADAGDGSCVSSAVKMLLCYDIKIKLEESNERLPEHVTEKFPHIRDLKHFQVPPALDVKTILKHQLAVAVLRLFSTEAVSLFLWAPTAQDVNVLIYSEPEGGDPLDFIELEESHGVWSTKGPVTWEGCYYVYEVTVYHPSTLRIEKCIANDPYARGLSADGRRTLIVNVDSETEKPKAWDNLVDEKPNLLSFSDISIYELHVRDFSASDNTVPSDFRGGYLAFTLPASAGMLHLKKLSGAGITHIHLLPTFQFAGVDDKKDKWQHVDIFVTVQYKLNALAAVLITQTRYAMLESFPPDSEEQQACITAIQNADGYNWGYNPVLWGVPKGSYASNPNGSCRIIEFRKMVQALNHIGLRVVLDVVYNHLHASGPHDDYSVLDKIVPGYYLRRNLDGFIEHSTCINNTASEHSMVERLIIDDLLHWAVNYKVDGFRFDLMGHIMKRTMVKARSALQSLSKHNDGVDGSRIYIYGEGWDFGEVAKNGRGVNASQFNLSETGIGSFNDRIRDAMLGGSPFGHPLQQGFITGLSLEPNDHDHDHGSKSTVDHMLAVLKDHIQVGMAANLKDFVLTNHEGQEVKGCEISMHDGAPVAYALSPIEIVNYVSAHDNETLFDIVSLKTPLNISVDARCRMNHLATSIIALSQGIPFFHAGDEILRSKSLDRDSYNSGDWFNRLDFSYNSNNWAVGLPPKEKNERNWPLMKTRLADPAFKPQRTHILAALENFCSFISIRYSSPLFRLDTAKAVKVRRDVYAFPF